MKKCVSLDLSDGKLMLLVLVGQIFDESVITGAELKKERK